MATTIVPGARQHGLPPGPRAKVHTAAATNESAVARRVLIGVALAYLFVFLGLPLYVVFQEALRKGLAAYFTALREPELLPLMEEQGVTEEEAAVTLGASGWQIFRRVTAPNIRWGLLYGIVLCNARAMGEFGAVSVVSGHIRGETNTMPLLVEILYNEYQFVASFAIASLLAMLALITLVMKTILERHLDEGQLPHEH